MWRAGSPDFPRAADRVLKMSSFRHVLSTCPACDGVRRTVRKPSQPFHSLTVDRMERASDFLRDAVADGASQPHIPDVGRPDGGWHDRRFRKDASMTKLDLGSHPHLLGFDRLERLVERTARSDSDGYPPFNIERRGSNAYRITLAVAGFGEDDLGVTVEDRQLVVRGKHADEDRQRVFLHRGIAARRFQRSFALAEGVEVSGAWLENGILSIDLERVEPKKDVQTIKISRSEEGETA